MKLSRHYIFQTLGFITLWMVCQPMPAQNLVSNGSFENITDCPLNNYDALCIGYAPPWECGTLGRPGVFNVCANPLNFGVPINHRGFQEARTGDGYAGLICKWSFTDYTEYLMIELNQPLDTGVWYSLSFYLNLGNSFCGLKHFGAYFSVENPYQAITDYLTYTPQIETNLGYLNDTEGWMPVTGCYLAQGGESYLMLGNFRTEGTTQLDPDCDGPISTFYYIEDVLLVEGNSPEELMLDVESPAEGCYSYEIDPMHPGPGFYWNTGDRTPTLTVTESGIYTVTVSDGCNTGTAEVEVTIRDSLAAVDLGEETLTLCEGNTFDIELDPNISGYTWQDGSTSSNYTITQAGTYAVTLDDGCSYSTDQIEVTTLSPPLPLSLGADTFLCDSDEIQYDFDPSLGEFLWQDGSQSPSYTVQGPGLYTLTISNECGEQSDDILISELEIPEIFIGPENQLICSGEIIDIFIDPSLGNILWNDGWNQPDYQISSPGQYTVYVTNECGTGNAQINVTSEDNPHFEFGMDTLLCPGDTLVLTTSVANGIYTWQDNSSNDSMIVTTSGSYSLQIQNNCGSAMDEIIVSYLDTLQPIDLGPDVQLCSGQQITLQSLNTDAQHIWQDGSNADTLQVTTSGLYYLTEYNQCETVSDTISILVTDQPPAVDLADQVTVCNGDTIILDANITGVNYHWSDNSTTQQISINTPGQYSVTVSNLCGSDQDTITVIDGGPAPFVELGNNVELCAGESIVLTPDHENVNTWLWSDGSALAEFIALDSGVVTVVVSNQCGVAYDTMEIHLLPTIPMLDLGSDTAICSGDALTLSIPLANVNILWPDGSIVPDFTVQGPASVIAQISNSCGISFDTVEIGLLPNVPTLDLGADQSLCSGEMILIEPGINMVSYLWQDSSTNTSFTATQAGEIILVISNACSSSTDTLEIVETTTGPQLDLGDDIQVCEGSSVSIQAGILGVDYLWQDGSTNSEFTTNQTGEIILQVSNNCGSDTDTVWVDISGIPPTPALGDDITICENTPIILISGADAETTIEWQDGSTSVEYIVTLPGTYILTESNHCGEAADTVEVIVIDAPDPFTLGEDTILCPGEVLILTSPSELYDIHWQDSSKNLLYYVDRPGFYSLQLSNDCGTLSDTIHVAYDKRIPQLDPDTIIEWCEGDIITLDAEQTFEADYFWSTGSTEAVIQISEPGLYNVKVTAPCQTTSQTIEVANGLDCFLTVTNEGIYIPNSFSPNGDGINDVFMPGFGSNVQIISMQGSIYDRWGNLVYNSNTIPFTWDGGFAGENFQPGVFVCIFLINYSINGEEKEKIYKGDVTLVR